MDYLKKYSFYFRSLNVYLKYKLKRPIPFLFVIDPTLKCNLKCKYCFMKDYNNIYEDMDRQKLLDLINQISKINTPVISFSGGEPLNYKWIFDAAEYAKKKGIVLNLNTNGTLITEDNAYKIVNLFDYIRISLDGDRCTHDYMSGLEGTYDKVIKGIKLLKNIPNRKSKLGINIVINETNKNKSREFLKNISREVDFVSFLPEFNFRHDSINSERQFSSNSSMPNGYIDLCSLKKNGNTKEFLKNVDTNTTRNICSAGKLVYFIGPSFKVYACPFVPSKEYSRFELGNLNSEKLKNIVHRNYRNNIQYPKFCSGCHAICTSEVFRLFDKSPIELLHEFKNLNQVYKI